MIKKTALLCFFSTLLILFGISVSGQGYVYGGGEVLSTWVFFLGFNKVLSNKKLEWKQILLGSILGGTGWYGTKWGFTAYVHSFATSDQVYAILGVLPLFFLWIYCSVLTLLLSACFNYSYCAVYPATSQHPLS
jgi:YihY family inner membrane protein